MTSTEPSARLGAAGHAQVDDVAAQLRIDHPAQDGQHILGGGKVLGHRRILPVGPGETPEAAVHCRCDGGRQPRLSAPRLAVLKALGDNTRYAIYLELARSPRPLATAEVAETLDLHPNTVRPHLERMREVGLLDIETDARGTVGRPQHRYSLAAGAPSSASSPPPSGCWPACCCGWPPPGGWAATRPSTGRDQGQADAELAIAAKVPAWRAWWPGSTSWGSTRRWRSTARRATGRPR